MRGKSHKKERSPTITIGLYPDLPREKMVRQGNISGEGARQVLLSNSKRLEAEEIARSITYFEMNANQEFMNRFVSSKFLPHTKLDYYLTVKAKLSERGLLADHAIFKKKYSNNYIFKQDFYKIS